MPYWNKILTHFLVVFLLIIKSNSQNYPSEDNVQNSYPNQINSHYYSPASVSFKEEITIDEVDEDVNFKAGPKVKVWKKMKIGPELYLLGLRDEWIHLVTLYKVKDNLQVHESAVELSSNVSCAIIFKKRQNSNIYEGFILAATSNPTSALILYKIKDYNLIPIWELQREQSVTEISHFTIENEDRFLIVEKSAIGIFHVATLFGFNIKRDTPNMWFLESMPLNGIPVSQAISVLSKSEVRISLVYKDSGILEVYRYKKLCQNSRSGKLELSHIIKNAGGRKLETFILAGGNYLALSGPKASIYHITSMGELHKVADIGDRIDLLVITVKSEMDYVLILGKSDLGEISLHINSDPGKIKWERKKLPLCKKVSNKTLVELKECIGGKRSWDGAIYLDIGNFPSVLFANQNDQRKLYHFILSLRLLPYQSPQNLYWLHGLQNNLELSWNRLRQSIDRLSKKEKSSSSNTSASWEQLCLLETHLTELAQKILDTKLRANAIDCNEDIKNEYIEEYNDITLSNIDTNINRKQNVDKPVPLPYALSEYTSNQDHPPFAPEMQEKNSEVDGLQQLGNKF